MSAGIYFRDDLARILASKAQAASRSMSGDSLRGYLDAITDLAVEFGLDKPEPETIVYDLPREGWIRV